MWTSVFYNHALAPGFLDAANPISLALPDPEICRLEAGRPTASGFGVIDPEVRPCGVSTASGSSAADPEAVPCEHVYFILLISF